MRYFTFFFFILSSKSGVHFMHIAHLNTDWPPFKGSVDTHGYLATVLDRPALPDLLGQPKNP